jgi:Domain of unknown function (DUF929)
MGRRATINARKRRRRILSITVVVAVIAILAVVYIAANQSASGLTKYIYQPVNASLVQQVAGVSDSTLNTIGASSGITPPASITGTALTLNGKPEVLYIGGEYCPYCAIERWSIVIALSRFGQFSGLEYMLSSSTDINPNTPTFTFQKANYTSSYISFVAVEEFDRSEAVRQALTTDQQTLVNQYGTCAATGTSGGIPFIDLGNKYAVNCGAQTSFSVAGENWTQVAGQLNNPSSPTARAIDAVANTLITAICNLTSGQPTSVCNQSYAMLSVGAPGASSLQIQSAPNLATRGNREDDSYL